jgi:hypothetical protein
MPQVKTETTFSIRLNEKEFKTMTQALAYLAGISQARPRAEDIASARDLNDRLLDVQVSDLEEKLRVAESKQIRSAERSVIIADGDQAGNQM